MTEAGEVGRYPSQDWLPGGRGQRSRMGESVIRSTLRRDLAGV